MTIENRISCEVNKENSGTHLLVDNEYNEVSIHMLGPWENKFRKELVVCVSGDNLAEFKKQVASL